MLRLWCVCIALLTFGAPMWAFAQSSDGPMLGPNAMLAEARSEGIHAVRLSAPPHDREISVGEVQLLPDESMVHDPLDDSCEDETPCPRLLDEFLGYRYSVSSMDWMIGGSDQFGMFSLDWDHYKKAGEETGIGVGVKIHFLDGPSRTEMPPRLFDFSLALQSRKRLGRFGFDVAASVMASSDFEGSAREGIRFPGHAVGYWRLRSSADLVFGIDYLDRGDIRLLPVGGLILNPHPDVRLELVFPRPSVTVRVSEKQYLYLRGELGGSTWDIQRFDISAGDVATYRDLRLCIGIENVSKGGSRSAFEIGYLFHRRLQYASGIGDYDLDDTAILRLVQTF